jgi:hypothetical protein
LFQQDLP